jgi:hypothetical protein
MNNAGCGDSLTFPSTSDFVTRHAPSTGDSASTVPAHKKDINADASISRLLFQFDMVVPSSNVCCVSYIVEENDQYGAAGVRRF